MRPEDITKLLGGYATGTLTEAERDTLFRAALGDQNLFDALAGEQALKELLDDPASRAQLLRALGEAGPAWPQRARAWFGRPASWAMAGGLAAAVVLVVLAVRWKQPAVEQEPVLMAKREAPAVEAPAVVPPGPVAKPSPPLRKNEARAARLAAVEAPSAETRAEEPVVGATSQIQAPAIVYRILRRRADGNYAETDAATVLASGDEVKIAVEPNMDGYLQVTVPGRAPLFAGAVQPGVTYNIPDSAPIRLEPPAGELRLAVTLTRRQVAVKARDVAQPQAAAARKETSLPEQVTVEIPLRHR